MADGGLDVFLTDAFVADPYPAYEALRRAGPAVRLPNGMWATAHYDLVRAVVFDKRFGHDLKQSIAGRHGQHVLEHEFLKVLTNVMLTLNPPEHTRLRKLVVHGFSARRVEALRGRIVAIVGSLIDRLQAMRRFDVIADFAAPLPVTVICDMLDVPEVDRGWFEENPIDLARGLDPTPVSDELRDRMNDQAVRYGEYFGALVKRRRAAPGDDLISALIQAEADDEAPLSETEIVNNVILLFLAGHDTTVNLIGNGLLTLHRHPEQLAWLRANPAAVPRAVEELLRFETPVQLTGREALEPVELGGVKIPAGETILAFIGAANRDPNVFDAPATLDLKRAECPHLAFGGGIHYCLGAQLARIEAAEAFAALLERAPTLALDDPGHPRWRRNAALRGLKALPASV